MRVMTALAVHRVGSHRSVLRLLCLTPPIYEVTNKACTYVEYDNGWVDVVFVDLVVDCMSCLVEEARSK